MSTFALEMLEMLRFSLEMLRLMRDVTIYYRVCLSHVSVDVSVSYQALFYPFMSLIQYIGVFAWSSLWLLGGSMSIKSYLSGKKSDTSSILFVIDYMLNFYYMYVFLFVYHSIIEIASVFTGDVKMSWRC